MGFISICFYPNGISFWTFTSDKEDEFNICSLIVAKVKRFAAMLFEGKFYLFHGKYYGDSDKAEENSLLCDSRSILSVIDPDFCSNFDFGHHYCQREAMSTSPMEFRKIVSCKVVATRTTSDLSTRIFGAKVAKVDLPKFPLDF